MTVLSIIQDASNVIGIERPDQVFSSDTRTMREVQEAINEAARQVLNDYDWQALTKTASIAGDGSSTAFPLPTDYFRMTKTTELWSNQAPGWNIVAVEPSQYLALDATTITTWQGYWSIFGNNLNIMPARASGETVRFLYINKNFANSSGGTPKASFTADDDTFVLDDRILRLCFIAQWKANKGVDFAADQNSYEMALNYAQSRDKGTKIVRGRGGSIMPGTRIAYPWPLGS